MRHIYFSVVIFNVIPLYFLFSKFISRATSFGLASLLLLDVMAIPSISYNSIARWFFCLSIILMSIITLNKPRFLLRYLYSILAGFLFTLCVLSYPPLILAVIIFFGIIITYSIKIDLPKDSYYLLIGSFSLFTALSILFLYPYRAQIATNIAISHALGIHLKNLAACMAIARKIMELSLIPLLICIGCYITEKIAGKYLKNIPLLLSVLLAYSFALAHLNDPGISYVKLVSSLSFIGFFGYPLFSRDGTKSFIPIYLLNIIPLIFAGIITALSSANGYANIAVCISPGAIFALFMVYLKLQNQNAPARYFKGVFLLTVLVYSYLQFSTIYGEPFVTKLNTMIPDGPYKNIMTTKNKADFLHDISRDLGSKEIQKNKTMLCYYNFPACYLLAPLRNNAYSTWITNWFFSKETFDKMLQLVKQGTGEFFLDSRFIADVIVRYRPNDKAYSGTLAGNTLTLGYDPISIAKNRASYRLYKKAELYEIYIKNKN